MTVLVLGIWIGGAAYTRSFAGGEGPFHVDLELRPALPSPTRQRAPGPDDFAGERETLQRSLRRIARFMEEGRLDRAQREVDMILPIYPAEPALLELAAGLHVRLDEFERAETLYARLNEIVSDNAASLTRWGNVLLWQGDLEKAGKVLERAHALDPYFTPTIMNLLCLYMADDRASEAAALLKAMTSQDLAFIADWLAENYELLVPVVGEAIYMRAGQAVLRGGTLLSVEEPAHRPAEVSGDYLTFSPAGQDLAELLEMDLYAKVDTAEGMKRRLREGVAIIRSFGEATQREQWTEAVRIGVAPNVSRIGLSAPSFRAWTLYAQYRAGEESALNDLAELSAQYPSNLYVGLSLTVALMEVDRYDDAGDKLRAMEAVHPDHALVTLLSACASAERGRDQAALAKLESLDESAQPFVRRWFASDAVYQQAILRDEAFTAWRNDYLTAE